MARDVEPNPEQLIRAWLDRHEIEVRGPMPGRIERYDAATQVADVKPMVRLPVPQPDDSVVQEDPPIIPCVPVLFPRVAGWFLSVPVAAGDFVLLVPCEGDWSRFWTGAGELSDAEDTRRHHLAHCVALPMGLYPERQALARVSATDLVMGSDAASGPRVQLKANGSITIIAGTGSRVDMQGATQAFVRGDSFAAAHSTFLTALNTMEAALVTALGAVNTWAGVVQPIGDPSGTATTTLTTALTRTLTAAMTAFTVAKTAMANASGEYLSVDIKGS